MRLSQILIIVFFLNFTVQSQNPSKPDNFGQLFSSDKMLLGKDVFKGDIGYSFSKISFSDDLGNLKNIHRHVVKINFNINPWKDFYFKNTFFVPLNQIADKPFWISDYYFSLGYYNWRNNSFSFGYENYQPNNFNNFFENIFNNLSRGFFFLEYKLILENSTGVNLLPFNIDETSTITIIPALRLNPEYANKNNELKGHFKWVIGLSMRYVILKNIYIESSLWYYPLKKSKLPWDPDFTYGFGVFDWRPFSINFSYGNWIANRFPWNEKELKNHRFINGQWSLNLTYSW